MTDPALCPRPEIVRMSSALKQDSRFHEIDNAIPYAGFLGMETIMTGGDGDQAREPLTCLRFNPDNIGNSSLPAIHGGVVAALLEHAAAVAFFWHNETEAMPKPVNISIQYLRLARPLDIFARAVLVRQGRQTAHLDVTAWQENAEKPVARAAVNFLLA